MANEAYAEGIDNILKGNIDLDGHTFRAVLVDATDYTPNTSSGGHNALDDIPAGGRIATSGDLAGLSISDGKWDASDISFSGSGGEDGADYVIVYKVGAAESDSYLLFKFDTGTGLPFSPPAAAAWTFDIAWDATDGIARFN